MTQAWYETLRIFGIAAIVLNAIVFICFICVAISTFRTGRRTKELLTQLADLRRRLHETRSDLRRVQARLEPERESEAALDGQGTAWEQLARRAQQRKDTPLRPDWPEQARQKPAGDWTGYKPSGQAQ